MEKPEKEMNRRGFVVGMVGLIAAPSVVHAETLMRVKPWSDVSAYGWINGEIQKIGDYCVGDQFMYSEAAVVSPLRIGKMKEYIKRSGWEELLRGKSTSTRYAPITIYDYNVYPSSGTLWHPVVDTHPN
jgi:hypothetical protein